MDRSDRATRAIIRVNRWSKARMGKKNMLFFHFVPILAVAVLMVPVSLAVAAADASGAVAPGEDPTPVLAVAAIFAGVLLLIIWRVSRSNEAERLQELREREWQRRREIERENSRQAAERQKVMRLGIRRSLPAARESAKESLRNLLASLSRFDHRLELSITPQHYADLFADHWVEIREFVESAAGRDLPDVSALLVEIIICYTQAQELLSTPWDREPIESCWRSASRRRKFLCDAVEAAQASKPSFLPDPVVVEEPTAPPIPEMSVKPPPAVPTRIRFALPPIPEMEVHPAPPPPSHRSHHAKEPAEPPPAPPREPRSKRRIDSPSAPAPKLSMPPKLEELKRYYDWVVGDNAR
jgi:hypothetical protein